MIISKLKKKLGKYTHIFHLYLKLTNHIILHRKPTVNTPSLNSNEKSQEILFWLKSNEL